MNIILSLKTKQNNKKTQKTKPENVGFGLQWLLLSFRSELLSQRMCVPTQILCCCLNEGYLAEKPSGENSWNSFVMTEHTWTGPWAWTDWVPTFPRAQISAKWALKLPSKSPKVPLGNMLSLKTALCHLLPSLHASGFMHFPLTLSSMMRALLSLNFSWLRKFYFAWKM